MLKRRGRGGHSCPNLRGKGFVFSLLIMMLAMGLSNMAFVKMRYISSTPNLFSVSNHERMLTLFKWCFCVYWDDYMIFIIIVLMWCITFTDLHMLNHPGIPGVNHTWLWCMILLMCCWIWFASVLLMIFISIFIRDIDL